MTDKNNPPENIKVNRKPLNGKFFVEELRSELEKSPSLTIAYLAQDYSAQVGFDFDNIEPVFGKVLEEIAELKEAFENREADPLHFYEELGDCLFTLVNLSRHAQVDPEKLLQENNKKYLKRCEFIENKLREEGRTWTDLAPGEVYTLWKDAKKAGF